MIKKSIVAIVVIVAAAALVFGASNHVNSTNNSDQEQSLSGDSGTSDNSGSDITNETKISSAEAQKIAQKYIEQPGASAGTPKLIKTNGQYVYAVPVIDNGTTVGEIDINALTGKNVGGAGGAP
jgi:uncharacterized membrane protein YkoI